MGRLGVMNMIKLSDGAAPDEPKPRGRKRKHSRGKAQSGADADEAAAASAGAGADAVARDREHDADAADAPPKKKKKKKQQQQQGVPAPLASLAAEEAAGRERLAEAEAAVAAREAEAAAAASEVEASEPPESFLGVPFSSLALLPETQAAIAAMKFETLTEIQARSIPPLLRGQDVLAQAQTGSGKTLSFLIPAVELLARAKWLPRNGTGAITISPTRELALQIYGVLSELCAQHRQTFGLVIGGANRRAEAEKLAKGVCAQQPDGPRSPGAPLWAWLGARLHGMARAHHTSPPRCVPLTSPSPHRSSPVAPPQATSSRHRAGCSTTSQRPRGLCLRICRY